MSGETVQRHRTDTRRKRGKETVMGLWVYFILANLRIDAQVFGNLATDVPSGLLPSAFSKVVDIMVATMIQDDVNGQDLIQVLAYLQERQASKPADLATFTMTEALRMTADRVYSHTENFKTIYPDAKHPILV
jgi:hypothetical protein